MSVVIRDDEQGMRAALREARASETADEVPVGCVVVMDGAIIGRGHNQVERLQDATAHAEILAIGAASNALQSWRLGECTLYVTLEPCAMCAGAMLIRDDEQGMRAALRLAEQAAERDEVPVGCVVVHDGIVVGRGHNQVEALQDATAHAEVLAIGAASNALGSWRLTDCTLYVTLEPCAMCAGAIVLARLGRLVYGAADRKAGACGSVLDVIGEKRLNHRVDVTTGVLADECGSVLREFFVKKRTKAVRP